MRPRRRRLALEGFLPGLDHGAGRAAGSVMRRAGRLFVGVVGLALLLVLVLPARPAGADQPIESTYRSPGPWSVITETVTEPTGASYVVVRPVDLGARGFDHPIVTWGNGSFVPVTHYEQILRQLASWGFVVVASTSTWTGSGDQILAGARYLVEENSNPNSVFHDRLATGSVGAMGHSQGAYGALSAAAKSDGLVKTIVPINLPDRRWLWTEHASDLSKVVQPVFLVGGSGDWISTPLGLLEYVGDLPGASTLGVRLGAPHDAVADAAGSYLGYITAWMMYQLQDDRYAAGAFRGAQPEIAQNPAWEAQRIVSALAMSVSARHDRQVTPLAAPRRA